MNLYLLPQEKLLKQAQNAGNRVIVVEDHYPQGGIGEAIAAALSSTDVHVVSCAVTKMPRSGTPEELLAYEGIDATGIVRTVKEHI
jgi:transketolase